MKFSERPQQDGGSGLPFLKLKDGEKVAGVFKGEPLEGYLNWETKKWTPLDEGRPQGSNYRFRVNFITKDGAAYVAKVWEQGSFQADNIQKTQKTAQRFLKKNIDEVVVIISRKGSGKDDTEYDIEIAENQPGEAGWRVINQVTLNNLSPTATKPSTTTTDEFGEPPPEAFNDSPEIPF